jgi:hypothetical protein
MDVQVEYGTRITVIDRVCVCKIDRWLYVKHAVCVVLSMLDVCHQR